MKSTDLNSLPGCKFANLPSDKTVKRQLIKMPGEKSKPFVIIGHARSGTGYLRSSIDSHPQAICLGELLHAYDEELRKVNHCKYFQDQDWLILKTGKPVRQIAEKYLTEKIWPQAQPGRAFGFKLLFWQIEYFDLWKYLSRTADQLRIILISRNPIAVYVSQKQASNTNQWIRLKGDEDCMASPVTINCEQFYAQTKRIRRFENNIRKLGRHLHQIEYENLVNNYQDSMNLIFEFLGLPPYKTHSTTLKQQNWDVKTRISNFDQFVKSLKRKYRVYLKGML